MCDCDGGSADSNDGSQHGETIAGCWRRGLQRHTESAIFWDLASQKRSRRAGRRPRLKMHNLEAYWPRGLSECTQGGCSRTTCGELGSSELWSCL